MADKVKKLAGENNLGETFSYGIVYIYSIPGDKHYNRLKIGGTTINSASPTQEDINSAADKRIKQQTKTADIPYALEHAELAITNKGGYFSDYDVHEVLKRSGYERKSESVKNAHSEWFEVNLTVAKSAINAVKEGRKALSTEEKIISKAYQFQFRPNQLDAIDRTTKAIKKHRKHFLWNAKMRFGKTSAAMQVAKENRMGKVLIVTHRPSVSVDWYDDFNKVFAGTDYQYSSKTDGEEINARIKSKKPFVYFASLQDLRLSKRVVEDGSAGSQAKGFDKNDEVFDTIWDMVIVDEAHEGTQSDLGDATFAKILTNFTLRLSGTPFNILHKHEEEDVYTWDYVMEQQEKIGWDESHPGVPNPYAELPALSIFTYDIDTFKSHIGSLDKSFHDTLDSAFKFHEFFRVHKDEQGNDTSQFVHEPMIRNFLDLLVDDSLDTKFPYATERYRSYNKHALWLLPNRVKVIEAMEKLLNKHPVFGSGNFGVVNISGDSRDDEEDKDAKDRVTKAIKNHDYTITLTGQRLTTGASIPEWTAVFMMSDTSSATTYLQTAFRCQTPARIDGKIKTQGYVFDFAPDRTLKLVAEAIELNHKSGKTNSPEQTKAMGEFLNFCPILAAKGGTMKPYDVGAMLGQLKKAIIERVSRNGFDDPKLYNDELLRLDDLDIAKFNELKKIVGKSTHERINEIEINNLGMDDLRAQRAEEAERKEKQKIELTEEEKEALKKLKEAREQKKTAIDILRGVSIRMPMLVYGANVSIHDDITLQKFIDLVDEESWREFMPAGLTKSKFREFTKYYDEDVFKGVARSIRAKAFDCDDLLPTERIQAIAEIFSTFKNPDKETVLTPWRVVNMHLAKVFGGHDFNDGAIIEGKPEWKSLDVDASIWSKEDVKILEINSKSGLYPLLAAYNVYSRQLINAKKSEEKVAQLLWNKVLSDHIYVLCKSPMAKSITQRTLAGYSGAKTNIVYIEDLVGKLQKGKGFKDYNLRDELMKKFGSRDKNMKFTAVVGNPPYQINTGTNFATPVYHLFFEAAKSLNPDYISLIHPARFLFNAGATPKEWNKKMLSDKHLSVVVYEPSSQKIFAGVDIKGGVCITLWDKNNPSGGLGGTFVAHPELATILGRVKIGGFDKIVGSRGGTRAKRWLDSYKRYRSYFPSSVFTTNPELFSENKSKLRQIKLVGLVNNKRIERYVSEDLVNDKDLQKWKVFIPKSNGSGAIGEVLSTPLTGEPLTGCTESFIHIGSFDSRSQAENCLKYIRTKFCRAMLGTLKVTQDNSKSVWKNVPLQDFTKKSDIDWSKSIAEIDKQLYAKYGLDKKEINFIETHVKAME